jgi:sulfur relay protein TusB/DsrH
MNLGVFVSDYTQTNDTLERLSADNLGLILVANGIYHATMKEDGKASPLLEKTSNIYVLGDDVTTRGLKVSDVDSRAKVVSYDDLVDLVMNDYEKVAWL